MSVNFKRSIFVKCILLALTFVLGGVSLYHLYHSVYYMQTYGSIASDYKDTYKFKSLYMKYTEYAALYAKYKEKGYEPDKNTIHSFSNSLKFDKYYGGLYDMCQENFDSLHQILNTENPSFFYYIKNTDTNDFYYPASMEEYIRKEMNLSQNDPLTSEQFDNYFAKTNNLENYLIINTSNFYYDTDMDPNYFDYGTIDYTINTLRSDPDYVYQSNTWEQTYPINLPYDINYSTFHDIINYLITYVEYFYMEDMLNYENGHINIEDFNISPSVYLYITSTANLDDFTTTFLNLLPQKFLDTLFADVISYYQNNIIKKSDWLGEHLTYAYNNMYQIISDKAKSTSEFQSNSNVTIIEGTNSATEDTVVNLPDEFVTESYHYIDPNIMEEYDSSTGLEKNGAYTETEDFSYNYDYNYSYNYPQEFNPNSYLIAEDSNLLEENISNFVMYTFFIEDTLNDTSEFFELKNNFTELRSNFDTSIKILPYTFLAFLVCFVLLLMVAGHKKGTDEIYLNGFDKIPMEFILLLFHAPLVIILIIEDSFLGNCYNFTNSIHILSYAGVIYTIIFITTMASIITFTKRLKAHTFLKSFFSYKFILFSITLLIKIATFVIQKIISIMKFFYNFIRELFSGVHLTWRNLFLDRTTALQIIVVLGAFTIYEAFFLALFARNPQDEFYLVFMLFGIVFLGFIFLRIAGDLNKLRDAAEKLATGNLNVSVDSTRVTLPMKKLTEYMNNIGDGLTVAVDDKIRNERFKTELITNVSHDIKNPLTSIISYVDLLKKEDLKNERALEYLAILEEKSWRLKVLLEDLVEASKASSGILKIVLGKINLTELLKQASGEFEDRFMEHSLSLVLNLPEEGIMIYADGRSTYRIIENLLSNVYKYALFGTRVYIDVKYTGNTATFSVKNISAEKLDISSEELTERFVRGDLSRNTDGNGLGLSIAKSLAELQQGSFELIVDGDLFKVTVTLPLYMDFN